MKKKSILDRNVFYTIIAIIIGFLIGAAAVCLISGFLTRYEAFKAETEDKIKKVRKDIRAMEDRERATEVWKMEQNARIEGRIRQIEESIATLSRSLIVKNESNDNATYDEGSET